jgi:hypothetical protein
MKKFVSKMLAGGMLATLAAGLVLPGVGRAQTAELFQLDPAQALIRCDTIVEQLTLRCKLFDQQQLGACLSDADTNDQDSACDKTAENELTEINLTEGIRDLTCRANSSYTPNPGDCGFGISLQIKQ